MTGGSISSPSNLSLEISFDSRAFLEVMILLYSETGLQWLILEKGRCGRKYAFSLCSGPFSLWGMVIMAETENGFSSYSIYMVTANKHVSFGHFL